MKIKDWIKKNEKLHYLGICLKMWNNKNFRTKLMTIYDKTDVLFFQHFGEKNPEKNIYMIFCDNSQRGFFSLFNLVLDGLQFADYYNLVPCVEFGESTLYHEKNGVNGTKNSFEYYFKQVSDVSVSSAHDSKNVIFYEFNHRKLNLPDFQYTLCASLDDNEKTEFYLNCRAKIIKKYIRFSDAVLEYLNNTAIPMISNKRTLGVHVRGTDMNVGYNGHAKAISPDEYLQAVKEAYSREKFEQVFLATDEAAVIDLFANEFGDRLVYFQDILRSTDGKALHFSQNNRENHKYLLGLEVLRDMYALSISDGLIAGISNVSFAARMMKKSCDKEYEYMNILSHGINKNGTSMV